ncbi:uncharacterized protein LOC62_02G002849 [Vanrija pseudolonga]|uniref:Uncharacterized protein n=1 Tax=Vanrija pseudolonga TaxID=143232 RepID=A0AAF0Y6U5_9TREE|nr:hypothetical protein LOC62_02G002849 [Vanrija pseudolonga]
MAIPPEDLPPPASGSAPPPLPTQPPTAADVLAAKLPPTRPIEHFTALDILKDSSVKGYSYVVPKINLRFLALPTPQGVQVPSRLPSASDGDMHLSVAEPQRQVHYVPVPIGTNGDVGEIFLPPGTPPDVAATIKANVAWAASRVHAKNSTAVWSEADDLLKFVLVPVDRNGLPRDPEGVGSLRPADAADARQFNAALIKAFGRRQPEGSTDLAPSKQGDMSLLPSRPGWASIPYYPNGAKSDHEERHHWIAVPVNELGIPVNQIGVAPTVAQQPNNTAVHHSAELLRAIRTRGPTSVRLCHEAVQRNGLSHKVDEVIHYVPVPVGPDGQPVGQPRLPPNVPQDQASQLTAGLLEDVRKIGRARPPPPSDSAAAATFAKAGGGVVSTGAFGPTAAVDSTVPPPPIVAQAMAVKPNGNKTFIPVPIGPDGKVVGTPRIPDSVGKHAANLSQMVTSSLNRGSGVNVSIQKSLKPGDLPKTFTWVPVQVDNDGKPVALPIMSQPLGSDEEAAKVRKALAEEVEGRAALTARLIADAAGPRPSTVSALASKQSESSSISSTPSSSEPVEQLAAPPASFHLAAPARHAVPAVTPPKEKCLTWCSQQADAPAMCRMWCLRKRVAVQTTQSDALARLRGGSTPDGKPTPSPAWTLADAVRAPFEALRVGISPYSIVYVKGTTEGVVGRYQEELEGDDGIYDFGPLSRHAPADLARKSTGGFEWLDWAENGRMVHVPLLSVFGPIVNLPANVEKVFGAPFRVAHANKDVLSEGVHKRMVERMVKDIQDGGAVNILGKITNKWFPKNPTPTASDNNNNKKKEKEAEGKEE